MLVKHPGSITLWWYFCWQNIWNKFNEYHWISTNFIQMIHTVSQFHTPLKNDNFSLLKTGSYWLWSRSPKQPALRPHPADAAWRRTAHGDLSRNDVGQCRWCGVTQWRGTHFMWDWGFWTFAMVRSFRNLSGSSGGMELHGLDEIKDTGQDVFFFVSRQRNSRGPLGVFTVKNLPFRCVDLECCQCTLFRRKKIVKLQSSGPTKKRRGAAALPWVERGEPWEVLLDIAPIFKRGIFSWVFRDWITNQMCHFSVTFEGGNLGWDIFTNPLWNGSGETNPFWQLNFFWFGVFMWLWNRRVFFHHPLQKNVFELLSYWIDVPFFFLSVLQPSSIVRLHLPYRWLDNPCIYILSDVFHEFFEAKIPRIVSCNKNHLRPSMSRWCRWQLRWRKISAQIWAYLLLQTIPIHGTWNIYLHFGWVFYGIKCR